MKPPLIRKWVIDHAPVALLTQAYELVVSFVLFLVAIPILGGRIEPASIHAQLPTPMVKIWAVGMLLGSAVTVVGLFAQRIPRIEWSGQILLGSTLALYAIAILKEAGFYRGGIPIIVFATLGALGGWRAFKISSNDLIQERLTREATNRLLVRHGGSPDA